MKKILFLIDSLGSGGAQRQLVGLAAGLKRRGYDVGVAYYYDDGFYARELDDAEVVRTFVADAVEPLKRIRKIRRHIARVRPDVVIPFLETPVLLTEICKLLGGRWGFIGGERNTTQRLTLKTRLVFALYGLADYIVPNSRSQARFIAGHYPRLAPKVRTIVNFVDAVKFSPCEEKTGDPSMVRYICVGRITPQKNVLDFLRAVSKARTAARPFEVRWYGRYEEREYMDRVEALKKELHLGDTVRFFEADREIARRYREADIFVLPSVYEGFPNVLCEAMSSGLPAVCSDVCDNPSILTQPQGGALFDPHDVDAMADALVRSSFWSPGERRQKGAFNRARVMENLTPERMVDAYVALIETL